MNGKGFTTLVFDELASDWLAWIPHFLELVEKEQAMSTTLDMIKVMQAFTEGKVVEVKRSRDLPPGASPEWTPISTCPSWNWAQLDYRIAPEPTYRPYTHEELVELIGHRVRHKEKKSVHLCTAVEFIHGEWKVLPNSRGFFDAQSFLDTFTHLDGTPCGVKVG